MTTSKTKKTVNKSTRSRAREFAVQALYQHLVGKSDLATIGQVTRDLSGFHKADAIFFDILVTGCIENEQELDDLILPFLDRTMAEISPIEHVIMWIGAYELKNCLDIPMRVTLNETIELAKKFGGSDGYKYVNGVLNQLSRQLRATELNIS